MSAMRQIILDIETTGLEPSQGHRIIEIAAIEMIGRQLSDNKFHRYINPQREIDAAATEVHGITSEELAGQPIFNDIAVELLEFLKGAELVIHNAPFDVGFLNHEFKLFGLVDVIKEHCQVLDTLVMARHKHPGQKNSLDALCRRYHVDNSRRTRHSALLDAEILADVYREMTGGQTTFLGESDVITMQSEIKQAGQQLKIDPQDSKKLTVIPASAEELEQHSQWLALLHKKSEGEVVWDKLADSPNQP